MGDVENWEMRKIGDEGDEGLGMLGDEREMGD